MHWSQEIGKSTWLPYHSFEVMEPQSFGVKEDGPKGTPARFFSRGQSWNYKSKAGQSLELVHTLPLYAAARFKFSYSKRVRYLVVLSVEGLRQSSLARKLFQYLPISFSWRLRQKTIIAHGREDADLCDSKLVTFESSLADDSGFSAPFDYFLSGFSSCLPIESLRLAAQGLLMRNRSLEVALAALIVTFSFFSLLPILRKAQLALSIFIFFSSSLPSFNFPVNS